MQIKVTVEETYELSTHPETGEPISDHREAVEVFMEDPGYFDWDEREIRQVTPHADSGGSG